MEELTAAAGASAQACLVKRTETPRIIGPAHALPRSCRCMQGRTRELPAHQGACQDNSVAHADQAKRR